LARARSDKAGRAVVGQPRRDAPREPSVAPPVWADAAAPAADAAARDMIANAWRGALMLL